jgi:hypothetical protein
VKSSGRGDFRLKQDKMDSSDPYKILDKFYHNISINNTLGGNASKNQVSKIKAINLKNDTRQISEFSAEDVD